MKTSFAFPAVLAGVLICFNVCRAQSFSIAETETFTAKLTQLTGSSSIRVLVTKPAGKKLWITVWDAGHYAMGYIKISEETTNNVFVVDMKEMPDGKYTFELQSEQKNANGKRPIISKTVIKERAILAQPILGEQFVFSN